MMSEADGAGRITRVLCGPSGAERTAGGITLGVEEEFVLLDPSTGAAVPAGPDLVRMLDGEPGVQQELMQFQVETGTSVCTGLDDVGSELIRLRRLVAAAAERLGCRLVASGIAPFRTPGLAVSDQPRYRALAQHFGPLLIDAGGTCGCHVHVGVPSRDLGVQVLARLRPWLASLLAITVNSPIAGGRDTAWGSWRYPVWSRWPTAAPPAVWPDAVAYDATVQRLINEGVAIDEQGVYLFARLSTRYPTVEVRVADVCLDVDTAVLLAGLTRALIATALAEARRGTQVPAAPWVDAALAAGARHGLAGAGVDPFTGQTVGARSLRARLVDHAGAALTDRGDAESVVRLLDRLDNRGTGADRQRAFFADAMSVPEFVEALARATLSGDGPAAQGRGAAARGSGLVERRPEHREGVTGRVGQARERHPGFLSLFPFCWPWRYGRSQVERRCNGRTPATLGRNDAARAPPITGGARRICLRRQERARPCGSFWISAWPCSTEPGARCCRVRGSLRRTTAARCWVTTRRM